MHLLLLIYFIKGCYLALMNWLGIWTSIFLPLLETVFP